MEHARGRLESAGTYAMNIGAWFAQRELPARGPLAAASDDLDRLGLLIETIPPRGLGLDAEARELATVLDQWTTVLRRLDRKAGDAWISFAAGPPHWERTAALLREGSVDATSMFSIGYAVLQAYGRLELGRHGASPRRRKPGSREPEWWGVMLAELEPREPAGDTRAAWRYLDIVLTGARERIVAHRGVGHLDEIAVFSDRTIVLHRRIEGSPPQGAIAQVEALYGSVVGAGVGVELDDMVLQLVRSAHSMDAEQRTRLRRLFADVGYPPIDPVTVSRRITELLRPFAPPP